MFRERVSGGAAAIKINTHYMRKSKGKVNQKRCRGHTIPEYTSKNGHIPIRGSRDELISFLKLRKRRDLSFKGAQKRENRGKIEGFGSILRRFRGI